MPVNSRESFKEYCLRALGAPVIEINVDDDQLEDRIDEALEYWRLYHYDGIEQVYLKHRINASKIIINQSNGSSFDTNAMMVTGATSGATAMIIREVDGTASKDDTLIVRNVTGNFILNEVITSENGASATFKSVELGEVDKRYIDVPDHVYGITRIVPIAQSRSSRSIFDLQYQLRLHDIYDLTSTSLIYYDMTMSYLSLMDFTINAKPMLRFNRMTSKLNLDIDWKYHINPGEYILIECYRALDPNTFYKVWNDPWLKHYATALFKRQWGQNLSKFSNMQLPGGVMIDGNAILADARTEIEQLENDLMTKSAPLEMFMG